jgi:SAM-dependent methyltransferase
MKQGPSSTPESIVTLSPKANDTSRINFDYGFDWLKNALPNPPRRNWITLEAGQGRYGFSSFYRQEFDTVYGADLEDYSAFNPGVIPLKADFCQGIPLPDQSIDLLVSHSVLEHVIDFRAALRNFDRVLKVGRYAFITISPLYYSARGSHVNPPRLTNWEHLDPSSPYYLVDNPRPASPYSGHTLNKMTFSDFIGAVGELPWSILSCKIKIDESEIPPHVDRECYSEVDLRMKGFYLLACKEWHCES